MLAREAECAAIDDLLVAARCAHSTVLQLEGEAGIGKTALCNYAVTRAEDMTVLRVLGSEWESHFPLAAVSELLQPLRGRADALMPAQRDAMRAVFGELGRPGVDQYALAGGALSLITVGAEERPVLVVVDDAQWLDDESAAALSFALKRLGADRVAVLLASRSTEHMPLQGPWRVHRVDGLGPNDASQLLTERAGCDVSPRVAAELARLTAGNPLALIELATELTPSQLAARTPLPDPLPVGVRGTVSFGRRLGFLPLHTREALVLLAAAGITPSSILAAAFDHAGHSFADLEPAEDVGVIHVQDGAFQFSHPLVRAAAYSAAKPAEQRRAHRVLAETLHDDVERRAWHLAAATVGPAEDVAEALDQAAQAASRRGGAAAAGLALARAAEVTPEGPVRWRRLLDAGEVLYLGGRWKDSVSCMSEILSRPLDPELRSAALVLQAKQATWTATYAESVTRLEAILDELVTAGDSNSIAVGLQLADVHTSNGHLTQTLEITTLLRDVAKPTHALADVVELYHILALLMTGTAPCPPNLGIERVIGLSEWVDPHDLVFWAPTITFLWNWTDRPAEAAELAERQIETLRRLSAASLMAFPLTLLADARLQLGDLVRARVCVEQAIAICLESHIDGLAGLVHAERAILAAVEGDAATCSQHAAMALDVASRTGQLPIEMFVNFAHGLLALATGHPDAAVEHLRPNTELGPRGGLVLPTVVRWHGDFIHALVATGRLDEARAALSDLEDASERTDSRWGRAVALRSHALLEPDWAEEALHRATELQADFPYEQARSLLVLGDHLRRLGRTTQARENLTRAADLFHRCGARPWAERAESALRATGVHRARRGTEGEQLTEQELQVALAIADGATNKEVAASMFLSQKTVEYHLAKAFRKLGVNNRTQLARALLQGAST